MSARLFFCSPSFSVLHTLMPWQAKILTGVGGFKHLVPFDEELCPAGARRLITEIMSMLIKGPSVRDSSARFFAVAKIGVLAFMNL